MDHFFFFFLASASLKSWIFPCSYRHRHVVGKCNEWVTKPNCHGKVPLAKFVIHCIFVRNLAKLATKPVDEENDLYSNM